MNKLKKNYLSGLVLFLISSSLAAHPLKFQGGEHAAAGDSVTLRFAEDQPAKENIRLNLANGLALTYGELVAMGDFYEIVDKPISEDGLSDTERKSRFTNAFNFLSKNSSTPSEAKQILAVLTKERNAIDEGMAKGEQPQDIYNRIHKENDHEWNKITGGSDISMGRYLKLATKDYSHFGNNAVLAYNAGHDLALEQAIKAHETFDTKMLEQAYAMDAFASHFLCDRFSTGHIRTPRTELPNNVKPSLVGAALVSYMHNEENEEGLHVHNTFGDKWIAWGDNYYFTKKNAPHRKIVETALQVSADQIFYAYITGKKLETNKTLDFIPLPDEKGMERQTQDLTPLFVWDAQKKKLLRRSDLSNPFAKEMTESWWGWTTLVELARIHGVPIRTQLELTNSSLREDALKKDLITNKALLKNLKSVSSLARNP